MLYEVAAKVDAFLDVPARRIAARSNIDYFLRRLCLPPLRLPVLKVPAEVYRRGRSMVRSAMRAAVNGMRCEPAKRWVWAHMRITCARTPRWCDYFSGNRCCRRMCTSRFVGWEPSELARELSLSTLRAVPGPWRLPCWPTEDSLRLQLSEVWHPWAKKVNLHGRAKWIGASEFEQIVEEACVCKAAPDEWGQQERDMKEATESGGVLVADDRDAGKAWSVSGVQMFLNICTVCCRTPRRGYIGQTLRQSKSQATCGHGRAWACLHGCADRPRQGAHRRVCSRW